MKMKTKTKILIVLCAVVGLVLVFTGLGSSKVNVESEYIMSDSKEENEKNIECYVENLDY